MIASTMNLRLSSAWLLLLSLILLAANPTFAQTSRVSELRLRRLAEIHPDFLGDTIEVLDHLKSCGVQGEIVRIDGIPAPQTFQSWGGLYLMVDGLNSPAFCQYGPFSFFESERARLRMMKVVYHTKYKIFISLSSAFYLRIAVPGIEPSATELSAQLGLDNDTFVFFGQKALAETVNGRSSLNQSLSEDVLELLSLKMSLSSLMSVLNLTTIPDREQPGAVELFTDRREINEHLSEDRMEIKKFIVDLRKRWGRRRQPGDLEHLVEEHVRNKGCEHLLSLKKLH